MAEKKNTNPPADPLPKVMKMAKEMRSAANKMTDDQRAESFRYGMQLIYGGDSRKPTPVSSSR